ncbi:MAG: hypothetical protein LBR30_03880, partial [Clostridioides sp.]|nr:hypothetical protein [Clostridioides sp.]
MSKVKFTKYKEKNLTKKFNKEGNIITRLNTKFRNLTKQEKIRYSIISGIVGIVIIIGCIVFSSMRGNTANAMQYTVTKLEK